MKPPHATFPLAQVFNLLWSLDILAVRFRPRMFSPPGGRLENSPAVHCRERTRSQSVPKGRLNLRLDSWMLGCLRAVLSTVPSGLIPAGAVPRVETLGYFRSPLREDNACTQTRQNPARVSHLLRFPIGRPSVRGNALNRSDSQRVGNPRYSRLEICATKSAIRNLPFSP
jgi:hypothetical protein